MPTLLTSVNISAIQFKESASPGTPASGFGRMYVFTDSTFHFVNDAGTDLSLNAIYAGGIAIASQAANDLIYASSSTQLARLANGTTGQVLTATTSAAPSWAAPAAAAAGSLTGTTLNATVVTSSLTAVGTITSGVWNAGAVTSSGDITYGGNSATYGALVAAGTNGVGIAATNASGAIRFYSGGTTVRFTIQADGGIGLGALTGGAAGSLNATKLYSNNPTSGGAGDPAIWDTSSGEWKRNPSSARYKENIEPWVVSREDLAAFIALSPLAWDHKGQRTGTASFISEDLAALPITNPYGMSPLVNYEIVDGQSLPSSTKDAAVIGLQHLVLQDHDARLAALEAKAKLAWTD